MPSRDRAFRPLGGSEHRSGSRDASGHTASLVMHDTHLPVSHYSGSKKGGSYSGEYGGEYGGSSYGGGGSSDSGSSSYSGGSDGGGGGGGD